MKLTYEQLEKKCVELEEENQQLRTLLTEALARIAALEDKLNKNSKNSSKPPSTDDKPNSKKGPARLRLGRMGKSRSVYPPERIDHTVDCSSEHCPQCSSKDLKKAGVYILQQAELPQATATVTEYRCTKYRCRKCHKRFQAELPYGVPQSAFGPRLISLISTLTGHFHLAKREALALCKDLYAINIAVGTVPNMEELVSESLEEPYKRIRAHLLNGKHTLHFDETG